MQQWADTWVGPYRLQEVQDRTRVNSISEPYSSCFAQGSHLGQCRI